MTTNQRAKQRDHASVLVVNQSAICLAGEICESGRPSGLSVWVVLSGAAFGWRRLKRNPSTARKLVDRDGVGCRVSSQQERRVSTQIVAYFDPGSGSMLVQLLVGGGAGLWVLGKYLLERWLPHGWAAKLPVRAAVRPGQAN